jgi:hypothetical protein
MLQAALLGARHVELEVSAVERRGMVALLRRRGRVVTPRELARATGTTATAAPSAIERIAAALPGLIARRSDGVRIRPERLIPADRRALIRTPSLTLDRTARRCLRDGRPLALSDDEFDVLTAVAGRRRAGATYAELTAFLDVPGEPRADLRVTRALRSLKARLGDVRALRSVAGRWEVLI